MQDDLFSPLIFAYRRHDALRDGVLVDVSERAREAGFRFPVALTSALFADIGAIPPHLEGIADVEGRLWDVLFRGCCAIKARAETSSSSSSCLYTLTMPVGTMELYHVKVVCGPGDSGEPVLTLMKPEED